MVMRIVLPDFRCRMSPLRSRFRFAALSLVVAGAAFACSDDSGEAERNAAFADAETPNADAGPTEDFREGPAPSDALPSITFAGRRLIVDGEEFELRGVNWNPVGVGGVNEAGLDWSGFVEIDAPLMAAAGINAVRTFHPITDRAVLDVLRDHGIWVLNTVYISGGDAVESVDARVNAVKDHPAILLWQVGNEWNYNTLYTSIGFEQATARVEAVAARIQTLDARPVASVYGELPPAEVLDATPSVDVWGINAYRYDGFYGLFDDWSARSEKPMYMAEFGVDAYNAAIPAYDPSSHEIGTRGLLNELLDNHTSRGGVTFGGCLFEWADEWWKDTGGSPTAHDTAGVAPGFGPFPDGVFNEEWWGIVDIERTPRPAYDTVRDIFQSR